MLDRPSEGKIGHAQRFAASRWSKRQIRPAHCAAGSAPQGLPDSRFPAGRSLDEVGIEAQEAQFVHRADVRKGTASIPISSLTA